MEVAAIRFLIEKHVAIVPRSKSRNLSPKFFQSGNPKKTASIGKFRCLKLILRKKNSFPFQKARRRRGFLWFLVAKMKVAIFSQEEQVPSNTETFAAEWIAVLAAKGDG